MQYGTKLAQRFLCLNQIWVTLEKPANEKVSDEMAESSF